MALKVPAIEIRGVLTADEPVIIPITTGHPVARVTSLASTGPLIHVVADGSTAVVGSGTPVGPGEQAEIHINPTSGSRPSVSLVSTAAQPYLIELKARFTESDTSVILSHPASEWDSTNPLLRDGQVGYDETTAEFRVGDGVHRWSALFPVGGAPSGGLTTEQVQDIVGAMAEGSTNLTVTYNDTSGKLSFVPELSAVVCAAPQTSFVPDATNLAAALAAASTVILQPGTYLLYNVLVPSNRHLVIPVGTTVKMPDNIATGAQPYRIFTATTPGTNIKFSGGGLIDGNRRGGNHGPSENILGIDLADAQQLTVDGLRFYNFRGDAIYIGHSSTVADKIRITGCAFEDIGVKESGDSGNARQGVALIAASDVLIEGNSFDTIGSYAVDLEGNGSGDTFDNCVIRGNTYRDCVQGPVNITSPGSITNIDIQDRVAAGSLGIPNTWVKPAALQNIQERFRIAGDLTLIPGDSSAHDLPSIGDLVLQGVRAGDWVEVGVNGAWDNANTYRNLDVASIVSGSPVKYWGSRTGSIGGGVPSWRGNPAQYAAISGSVRRKVETTDIAVDGSLTVRLRYSFNSATTSVLYAGTLPLYAWVENHGSTP